MVRFHEELCVTSKFHTITRFAFSEGNDESLRGMTSVSI